MKAWIQDWAENLKAAQHNEQKVPTDLRARFLAWHNGLPEVSKNRAFSMLEIEQALNTQGRFLSPILLSEGWQRKRKWSSLGQYHRFWVPGINL